MLYGRKCLLIVALLLTTAAAAEASVFATGSAVSATAPDSITNGAGSIWVEYGNGADSTGASGSSTIVQYGPGGKVQNSYTIAGLVDGLKFDPVTKMIWALQNNDGNSTLSIINPLTNTVSAALSYSVLSSSRGYDDVAFLNGKVYLSYSNPVNPTDPVLQSLNNGNNPTGPLTTTNVLSASDTGQASSTNGNEPDIDSLKSTPSGKLVLTTEGDGPGSGNPVGEFTLISNPGKLTQHVTNVPVTTSTGSNVQGIDDVIFPGAKSGWLYVSETGAANQVDKVFLSGLDPNTAIIAIGGLSEVAFVNPTTGVIESAITGLTGLSSPHGMDFVPATTATPEPSTWAILLAGLFGVGAMARSARRGARKMA